MWRFWSPFTKPDGFQLMQELYTTHFLLFLTGCPRSIWDSPTRVYSRKPPCALVNSMIEIGGAFRGLLTWRRECHLLSSLNLLALEELFFKRGLISQYHLEFLRLWSVTPLLPRPLVFGAVVCPFKWSPPQPGMAM